MKISILIAHYNYFEYFRDCYNSILNQTFQDFEVIIVDDCSTDDSFEKIKELVKKDSRFKIFQNEENKGVGYTKKRCIELASGELCAFLDADDYLTPSAIEDAIQYFSKDYVAIYFQFQNYDNHLNTFYPIKQKQIKNNNPYFFNIFFDVSRFFVFRKDAYLKTEGINEQLTSAVDQDLYLKLYEQGNFKFIKKTNYIYRLHDNGVSQKISNKPKLHQNWHKVIYDALKRRNISNLYGKNISEIDNLPKFIYNKENTLLRKLLRKIFSI